MKMMDIEKINTTAQQEKSKLVSFKISPKLVVAISVKSPNPTTSDSVKNLFLNGFDLKQLSFVRAVNI